MWSKLSSGGTPLLYIAGGGDAKYREIMERLVSQSAAAAGGGGGGGGGGGSKGEGRQGASVRGEIVDGVGHAVLEEAPEKLSTLIGSFLSTASQRNLQEGGGRKMGRLGACLGDDDGGDGGCMICSMSVTRFSVPLTAPLQLSKGDALTRRDGVLVEINSMAGDTGYGECTPLPGFHTESLAECTRQLEVLSKRLVGRIIPRNVSRLDGSFQKWLSAEAGSLESFAQWHVAEGASANHGNGTGHELAKVVVAALEAAVVGVLADAEGVAVSALISAGAGCPLRSHLLLNGLATRSEGGSVSGGFAVYKIKVGGGEGVDADAKRLEGFEGVAGTTRLRLDANQAWSLEDAVSFVSMLSPTVLGMIEYIEEPLRDPQRLVEFYSITGMRYALDESIDQGRVPDLTAAGVVSCQGFAAAVVKPSVLGGVERSRQLLGGIREGATAGFDVVVSSAFETSLGLAHLAACAGGLNPATGADCARGVASAGGGGGGSGVAHGLGTYGRLGGELVVADGGLGSCVGEGGRLDVLACDAMVKESRHRLSVVLKAAQEN
jgi:o-succinylbenzoate synthase